ncbi:hypothetical protein [Szabonella alba]|uniref:Uncharacterized protein n=1 Tax=Szabonella alba TaxID=2804194 RepID=A0A8K0VE57_9RHOB|nr:hypothetical protein [Szabonella alba]MBL4917455.1 hypothetical protein [Szabonella alba]
MFDDPGRSSPERALWQEVLYRVISDARLDSDGGKIPRRRQEEYTEARAYLTEPSEDLALVCEMAGVDMGALVERIAEKIFLPDVKQ